ncbi:hypothetical protein [uncultured Rhodoferax sp.]|uniref:hypothetical protein n=1 Tax=uncultured Rhodoferax sp. TaxID=223188 RepID=UPI0025FA2BD8|nr:hypothetical protein [uncultured Rhodoferax sp.]
MSRDIIEYLIVAVVFTLIGNCAGDAQTLINCAKSGEAKMFSGGTVSCQVLKDHP